MMGWSIGYGLPMRAIALDEAIAVCDSWTCKETAQVWNCKK
jgi:hypothetical protein